MIPEIKLGAKLTEYDYTENTWIFDTVHSTEMHELNTRLEDMGMPRRYRNYVQHEWCLNNTLGTGSLRQ